MKGYGDHIVGMHMADVDLNIDCWHMDMVVSVSFTELLPGGREL